eukprot:g65933.t1
MNRLSDTCDGFRTRFRYRVLPGWLDYCSSHGSAFCVGLSENAGNRKGAEDPSKFDQGGFFRLCCYDAFATGVLGRVPPVYVIIEYASNLGYTLYTYGLTMITWITMSICHTISSKKIKPEGLPRWMKHCFKYSIVVWSVALVPVIGMAYYTDRYIYVMAYQTALLAATWLVFALSIRTYRRLHFLLTARREKMKEHSTPISILKPSVSINPRDTVTGEKNSSTTNNSDKGASSKKRYDEGSIVMRRFRNILLLQLATTVILSLLLYAAHFMSDDWTRFKLPDRDLPFFEGDKWPTQTSFRGYLVMIFCTVMFIFMSWRQPTDIEEDALSRRGMMSHAASGPSFSPERRDRRDRRPSERKNRRSMSALPSPSRLANDDSPSTDTRPLDRVSTPSRGEAPNLIRGE